MNAHVRQMLGFPAVVALAGLAGCIGTAGLILVLGGAREANVWDILALYQFGGLPAAAIGFHNAACRILRRRPNVVLELALFASAQVAVTPFAEFVVRSSLTGTQGHAIVVAALVLAAAGVTLLGPWTASASNTPEEPQEVR
jgi:hypothetical protein